MIHISIDLIIFFSSFEVIVLLLGVKAMTFVLYPLFRFQEIVKDWNTSESFEFECYCVINARLIKMKNLVNYD